MILIDSGRFLWLKSFLASKNYQIQSMKCLIPNVGSTSFKYRVWRCRLKRCSAKAAWSASASPAATARTITAAIHRCIGDLVGPGKALDSLAEVEAVGFKVVHPGPMPGPRLVDESLFAAMDDFAFFAPAHNPPYVAAMRAFAAGAAGRSARRRV